MGRVPENVDPAGRELWPGRQDFECTPYRETYLAQIAPKDRAILRKFGQLSGTALVCYDGPYCDEDYMGALRAAVAELYHIADYLGRYLGGELEAHVLDDQAVYECLLGGIFADKTIQLGNQLVRASAELRRRQGEGELCPLGSEEARHLGELDLSVALADLRSLVEATRSDP